MQAPSKIQQTETARRGTPSLDDFCAAVRDSNPFASNRITEPSSYDVDVPAIHAANFDRLVDLAGKALKSYSGIGAALIGGAGVGKSHLLSRLYRWANEPAQDGGPRACYAYLHNILADPDRLPRFLLKYVVSRLSEGGRGPLHQTPLFRLLDRAVHLAYEAYAPQANQPKGVLAAYRAYFEKSDVYEVLLQFYRHARPEEAGDPAHRPLASEALAWLSGDEIDPKIAKSFGLKVDSAKPAMINDDQGVQHVLLALARLALVSNQPLILCIDQFENLDPDKIKPLSRFLHSLLDHATNLLIITSGVKETLLAYKAEGVIPQAAWDRIAEYPVELKRVSRSEARKILETRLEQPIEPFMQVDLVRERVRDDTLFPLGRAWLDKQLDKGLEFRPRDILTWARDAWDEEPRKIARLGNNIWIKGWPHPGCGGVVVEMTPDQIRAAIDVAIDRKIEEQVSQHRLQPGGLPPDAGNLAGLVESLLGHCSGEGLSYTFRSVQRMQKKAGRLPAYDLLVRERREPDGREVTTGVLFVTNVGLSASTALKRLLEDGTPPDHRLLITDEERRPLKVGPEGKKHYQNLGKLGRDKFEHLKINFEQYARLDSLQGVVGMAKSGDLEIESCRGTPRPVHEADVVESHHRCDRFRHHPVLRPLLTEEPLPEKEGSKTKTGNDLEAPRVRQYIMAQLAWRMGSTAQALAKGFIEDLPERKPMAEDAWAQFKAIAEGMHADGLLHATPQDNDLFLLLKK